MDPVVIYTLRRCPYCVRAKALLDSKHTPYTEIDVTSDYGERDRISRRSGHFTFPQIYIGDAFIGGCDDLQALDRAGRLDPMLA
ncbi:MAG: glutaredoxin 3 [Candidatus Binatia bacterium]